MRELSYHAPRTVYKIPAVWWVTWVPVWTDCNQHRSTLPIRTTVPHKSIDLKETAPSNRFWSQLHLILGMMVLRNALWWLTCWTHCLNSCSVSSILYFIVYRADQIPPSRVTVLKWGACTVPRTTVSRITKLSCLRGMGLLLLRVKVYLLYVKYGTWSTKKEESCQVGPVPFAMFPATPGGCEGLVLRVVLVPSSVNHWVNVSKCEIKFAVGLLQGCQCVARQKISQISSLILLPHQYVKKWHL